LQDPKRSAPMKEHFDTIAHLRSCKPSTPRIAALASPSPRVSPYGRMASWEPN
jgi:hypothetical protein